MSASTMNNQELVSTSNDAFSADLRLFEAFTDPTQLEWEKDVFGEPVSPPTDFTINPVPQSASNHGSISSPIKLGSDPDFQLPPNSGLVSPLQGSEFNSAYSVENLGAPLESPYRNWDPQLSPRYVDEVGLSNNQDTTTNLASFFGELDSFEYAEPTYNSWDPSQFDNLTPPQQEGAIESTRVTSIDDMLNPAGSVGIDQSSGVEPRLLQGSGVVQPPNMYPRADLSFQAFPDDFDYPAQSYEQPHAPRQHSYPPHAQRLERSSRPRPLPQPTRRYTEDESPSPSPSPRWEGPRYSPRLKTMRDKEKEWIKSGPTTGANRRAKNIATYDPTQHYDPLPGRPRSWGHFRYTAHGELEENKVYTVQEMIDYLYYRPQDRPLVMWIQRVPSDSARRYPTRFSSHCRFQDCPGHRNTINIGQYRVTFDEQNGNRRHDPFHNAGYVHLYCLEKFFDFPSLCASHDVRSDFRELRHEPGGVNKMALGSLFEKEISEDFIKTCRRTGNAPQGYPRYDEPNRPYEGTLLYDLTIEKLEHERTRTQKQREVRGVKPSMISEHKNDLEVQTRERAVTRNVRNQVWKSRDKWRGKGAKRARDSDDDDDDDDEEEDNIDARRRSSRQQATRRGTTSNQAAKRTRRQYEQTDEYDSETIVVNSSRHRPPPRTRSARINQAPPLTLPSKRQRYDEQDKFDKGPVEQSASTRVTRSSSKRGTSKPETQSRKSKYAGQDEEDTEDYSEYAG